MLVFIYNMAEDGCMSTEDELRDIEALQREVFDAFEQPGDAEAINQLYSTDFLAINADGSTSTKEEAKEIVKAGVFPVSKTVTSDETEVRIFGNTAVVTGRSVWEGEQTVTVRHTQIWAKEDGEWQMVGWQGTPVLE